MKIIVTGGNGNIGAHIVRALLPLGHELVNVGRSEHSIHPPQVKYIRCDREDTDVFVAAMRAERADVAFEMTSFTPAHAKVTMEAFRGVRQCIVASTVCTYGEDFHHYPVREDDAFTPWTEYGIGKHAADTLYLKAYEQAGFPVTIVKPGTTYSVMSGVLRQLGTEHSWIDRVKKGKPILICGDGDALHQYMHSDDTAAGFVAVMGKAHCLGQVYNVVQEGFYTWAEFHRTAMEVLGRQVELVGLPLKQLMKIDPVRFRDCYEIFGRHTYVSNEKLKRDAPGWRPRIGLREGLTRVFGEMEAAGTIPNSDEERWEDEILRAVDRFEGEMPRI